MTTYTGIGHGRMTNRGGAYDPGTQGGGAQEHVQARKVVAHAAAELRRLGVSNRADGCPDGSHAHAPNWHGSAIRANGIAGLQVAVEVHFDWSKAPRGGFGIHNGSAGGRKLADAIRARYRADNLPVRAHQNRPGLGFLANTRLSSAILWECDRIDGYSDAYLRRIGVAVARGIADHLGVPEQIIGMTDPIRGGTVAAKHNPPKLLRIDDRPEVFEVKGAQINFIRNRAELVLKHGPGAMDRVTRQGSFTLYRYGEQDLTYVVIRRGTNERGWLLFVANPRTAAALAGDDWRSPRKRSSLDHLPV